MLKKILLAVAIALPFFGASAQQSVKIGLVDTNSILQAMPETSDAQKKLAEASKKYEDEFARLQEELKRLYDEFQAMKPDELQAIKDRKRSAGHESEDAGFRAECPAGPGQNAE